jgi:hypothetical protein
MQNRFPLPPFALLKPVADQSLPAPFVKGFTGIAAIATAVVF